MKSDFELITKKCLEFDEAFYGLHIESILYALNDGEYLANILGDDETIQEQVEDLAADLIELNKAYGNIELK